jgi:hypothetical protein
MTGRGYLRPTGDRERDHPIRADAVNLSMLVFDGIGSAAFLRVTLPHAPTIFQGFGQGEFLYHLRIRRSQSLYERRRALFAHIRV